MSENIDTRVTPSLHPINVRAIDGYDAETATILGPVETAFSEAYIGIGAVHDARVAAASNPTWNEAQRLITVDDFSQKQFKRIAARFDSVSAALTKTKTFIEAELSAPIASSAAHAVSGEIRAHTKSLPQGERMAFVQQAIKDGDTRTATSILDAPAYLSGISTDMQSVLTRIYHEHHQPSLAKRLKAVNGALDLIGQRGGLVFAELTKAVGAPAAKISKLRAAKTSSEKHFIAHEG